jgi:hypothetical protein
MKLTERLSVLIQATTLSQKSGALTLDEAVKAKSAIDVVSTGTISQNFMSAINVLIEIVVASQKKGVYSLKDAYMIYLSVNDIESEVQNEVNRINEEMLVEKEESSENVINVPTKKLKRQ